eukprot:CAMPEP_0113693394 /NCGR_PEP_ID=MMETSP0038_2-20120614/19638_1 /TAXON_ID=2898 /ORGANISM="Cryptomonas paramecium" /LENGTH=491 /DNA_ID=CAMNT_0000615457 /DNA_START=197 /DNA_END=1668 /DNA_ORIENTATION=- /assembly_acc=CAM_ASM_000170
MSKQEFVRGPVVVESANVKYSEEHITSDYVYQRTCVRHVNGKVVIQPFEEKYQIQTTRKVPQTGVMLVGWGGNNGSTFTAGILANRLGLKWRTKEGEREPNFLGSVTQSSTVQIGCNEDGERVNIPFKDLLPMIDPSELVIGGWDISATPLGDAMTAAKVLDYDLQRQLYPEMQKLVPLPSIYYPDFIAQNQSDRATHVLLGTKQEQLDKIRSDIRTFKESNKLDSVIVMWTANTERFSEIQEGVNDSSPNLLAAISRNEEEISPSSLFAVASILEGCCYINGSPQNTYVPGVVELAEERGVPVAGDDFKSGQTKVKSVLVDFLISAGIKVRSIVSYNHLGNNDGRNLSDPVQFRSKEISKSNVVDDMVGSNGLLYKPGEHPDHVVVIKYVPAVGDSKRAMDEYVSEIFLGGTNTIAMHNTCEDSLLAAPLMVDLVVLAELLSRVKVRRAEPPAAAGGAQGAGKHEGGFEPMHPVLSTLGYLLKAPLVPPG